jgi:hypothetical protein
MDSHASSIIEETSTGWTPRIPVITFVTGNAVEHCTPHGGLGGTFVPPTPSIVAIERPRQCDIPPTRHYEVENDDLEAVEIETVSADNSVLSLKSRFPSMPLPSSSVLFCAPDVLWNSSHPVDDVDDDVFSARYAVEDMISYVGVREKAVVGLNSNLNTDYYTYGLPPPLKKRILPYGRVPLPELRDHIVVANNVDETEEEA